MPKFFFVVISILLLVSGYLMGARHDYIAYQWQWKIIVSGQDPWLNAQGAWTTNSYGPLHNFFAIFYALHPLLPKLIFIGVWLGVAFFYLQKFDWSETQRRWLVAFLVLNPFFLVEFVSWGHHESVVAALILAAVVCARRNRQFLAGSLIGLGILMKFIPVFLVPFFWVNSRASLKNWNHRFLAAVSLVTGFGFACSLLIWGKTTFYPLHRSVSVEPTMLSIFHFLKDSKFPFGHAIPISYIWSASETLIATATLGLLGLYYAGRLTFSRAVLTDLMAVFLFYPLGHQQFQSSVLFLFPFVIHESLDDFEEKRALRWSIGGYAVFLLLFQLVFVSFGQYSAATERMDDWIAFPFFAIATFAIMALCRNPTPLSFSVARPQQG